MYHVYVIRSIRFPRCLYVGFTHNIEERLKVHNSGGSVHTKKYRPWELIASVSFMCRKTATDFEKYLKSGSGRAFIQKRLIVQK